MEEIKLNLDKSKKYVIACSFGPDSMALLDAAIKEKLNVVVAHVNYRKREAAIYEQEQLTAYCKDRGIKLYVLDLLGQKPEGNFQDWARKKRYKFFKQVKDQESADSVLVAHNEDDVIETYLMQKKRGNFTKNPGISRKNTIFGVEIVRPLLNYTKAFLEQYDIKNKVPYSIDESNLKDDYTRNKIRHSIVQKMTNDERKAIIVEIQNAPTINVEFTTKLTKNEFLNLPYNRTVVLLDYWMEKVLEHRNLSEKFINQIKNSFKTKPTQRIKLTKSLWLELDYNDVFIINASKLESYSFEAQSVFRNEWLDIDFSNGAEDRGITNLPASFLIKNCGKKDKYIIKDYSSEIRRLFIDWKMPLFLREVWPGIYTNDGKLLYVPRYRKEFVENHKSKFKINIDYFLEF